MKKWFFIIAITAISVHQAALLYSFVLDIEPRHIWEEYCLENHNPDISIQEWMARQDEAGERMLDWLGEGCAEAFDWTYEAQGGCGHAENRD